ncbi:acid protease [Polychaeton citri CBS 116435]|uniref:Probable aspartic-type endopeptidase OPSB n=1 Tax=Polychaeton citri CBS 116435 TaxID=1314669 RepID=A0A9P4UK06_9PEZI|nr:acid protease [Polychaeton citri CBS 116435]
MRTAFHTLAAAAVFAAATTSALNLQKRSDGFAPRVVQHDIQRRRPDNPIEHDRSRMAKRAGTVQVDLENEETLYYMEVKIGTPEQTIKLHLDTGSSDLWVNVADSSLCSSNNDVCADSGTYNANKSDTYNYINSDFKITYVDGSGSSGDYVTDVVKFSNITLESQQFGIGYQSTSQEGILGIGYPVNEVALSNGGKKYANVPQNMLDNGLISTNSYSLWLNDLEASTGSILFGGVNEAKYTGDLYTLPILKESGEYAEFFIALTAIGANGDNGTIASDVAIPALLDSGSSLMYLPDNITQKIYDATNSQYNSDQGAAFVDCNLAKAAGSLDFTFSGPTIRVDLSELVIEAGTDSNGDKVCILGIGPAGDSASVLGDTFIRSAYIVYDLTNNEISIAQTNFNTAEDNILEITNSTGVPSATVVQNAVTSVSVSESNGARINDQGTVTVSDFAAPTAAVGYTGLAAVAAVAAFVL